MGAREDDDRAVAAAHDAFASYSQSTTQERVQFFERLLPIFHCRHDEIAVAVSEEIGCPITF